MGPYNDESKQFEDVDGYERGHWYKRESDGALFIVPDAVAEIEGPDDATLDALNKIYRETPFLAVDADAVAEQLELEVVLDVLKRFDTAVGYYTA